MSPQGALVLVYFPPLKTLLLREEDKKGAPLSHEEVLAIRDKAMCIAMSRAEAETLAKKRGGADIDPEQCWRDYQQLRRDLHRATEAAPVPKGS